MYMSVCELNDRQMGFLKQEMYYGTWEFRPLYELYDYPHNIPDALVLERYDGVCFVEEDFC